MRGNVDVTARLQGQFEAITRIVAQLIRRELASRSVLEALVDGKDDHLAGSRQTAGAQELVQVSEDTDIVGAVSAKNFFHAVSHRLVSIWGIKERGSRTASKGRQTGKRSLNPARWKPLNTAWGLIVLLFPPSARADPNLESVCRFYSKFRDEGVPDKPLKQALTFWSRNRAIIPRTEMISIADYTQSSTATRYFLLNLATGEVQRDKVSHGSGAQSGIKYGDRNHDGRLDRCQWEGSRRNMTRPGFFVTGKLYTSAKHQKTRGRWPHEWPPIEGAHNGLRLIGKTPGINDDALRRGVVMHGAWYNWGRIMGRSYGCPAFVYERAPAILNAIKGGTLFFAYTGPICPADLPPIERQVAGWSKTCTSD